MAGPRVAAAPRIAAVLIAAAATATVAASPLRAAEPSALEWLMNEPVTLFDLGILRLRQDLADAAGWLHESGDLAGPPDSGVYYQWWDRRIIAYVTVREAGVEPEEGLCRRLFGRVAGRMMTGIPAGTRRAEIYLENAFLHAGPGNLGRPRLLAAELAAMVRFEVTLLPPPPAFAGGRRLGCSGPLDAAPDSLMIQVSG